MRPLHAASLATFLVLAACRSSGDAPPEGPLQTERDESLRYELLDPYDHEFRITYELSATTPGATTYCTPVRGDTFVSEVQAEDLGTGARLDVALVGGEHARAKGHPAADPSGTYFLIALDRPVPEHGDVRLRVRTKYEDRVSYGFQGEELVFARFLAAPDVGVVLPPTYGLVECNVPVRIARREDGRIELAYTKKGRVPLPLRIVARRSASVPDPAGASGAASAAPAAIVPPFACAPRAGLVQSIAAELEDVDARRIAWRHDLEVRPPLEALPEVSVAPDAGPFAVFARTSGERLAPRAAEPEPGGPRELAFDAGTSGTRVRLEATTAAAAAAPAVPFAALALAPAPLESIVLPAGWTPCSASQAVAVTPLPDGRTRIDLGHTLVAQEGLALELWRPQPRRAEPKAAPAPAARTVELD